MGSVELDGQAFDEWSMPAFGVFTAMNQWNPWSLNTSPRESAVASAWGSRSSDIMSVPDVPSVMSVSFLRYGTNAPNPPLDTHPNGPFNWLPGVDPGGVNRMFGP